MVPLLPSTVIRQAVQAAHLPAPRVPGVDAVERVQQAGDLVRVLERANDRAQFADQGQPCPGDPGGLLAQPVQRRP